MKYMAELVQCGEFWGCGGGEGERASEQENV